MGNSKIQSNVSQYEMNSVKEFPFWTDFFCGSQDVDIYENITNIRVYDFQQRSRLKLFYKLSNIQPSYLCPMTVKQYKAYVFCSSQYYRIHYKYIYNQFIPFVRTEYQQLRDQLILMLKELQMHHASVVLRNENVGCKNQTLCYILRWNDVRMSTIPETAQKQVEHFLFAKKRDQSILVRSGNQSNIVFNNRLNTHLQQSQLKEKGPRSIYYAGTELYQQKQPQSRLLRASNKKLNAPIQLKQQAKQPTQLANAIQHSNTQLKNQQQHQFRSFPKPELKLGLKSQSKYGSISKLFDSNSNKKQQQKPSQLGYKIKAVRLPRGQCRGINDQYKTAKQPPNNSSELSCSLEQPIKQSFSPIPLLRIASMLRSANQSSKANFSRKGEGIEQAMTFGNSGKDKRFVPSSKFIRQIKSHYKSNLTFHPQNAKYQSTSGQPKKLASELKHLMLKILMK